MKLGKPIVEGAIVRWQRKAAFGLPTSRKEPVKRLFFVFNVSFTANPVRG
jgi:hypothetical protein